MIFLLNENDVTGFGLAIECDKNGKVHFMFY